MEKEDTLRNFDFPTEQSKRMRSAEIALAGGRWRYWRKGETWRVKTPTDTYTLVPSTDGSLTCSCPDAQHYGSLGLTCKHVCGLRLWLKDSQTQQNSTEGGSLMTDTSVTTIIERLEAPLDLERVKWREGAKRERVPYLEGYDTIATANDIFAYRWSFEIGEPQVRQWLRTQTHWDKSERARVPTLGQDGQPLVEPVGVVWVTGRITIQLGGQAYIHADVGRCTFSGDTTEAFDTAISGCVTDCLKRCFRQLGRQFGNELYDKSARTELKKPGRKPPALKTTPMTPEQAGSVPCPLGAKSHPEYKGLALAQVAQEPDGRKVLAYLASDQYQPNGDRDGQRAKAAASLLLESLPQPE